MFVSIKARGILYIKTIIERAVAFPIPGRSSRTSDSLGITPLYFVIMISAAFFRYKALLLYHIHCHAFNNFLFEAFARDAKSGKCSMNSGNFFSTLAACVC